jgi:hypothetical protein
LYPFGIKKDIKLGNNNHNMEGSPEIIGDFAAKSGMTSPTDFTSFKERTFIPKSDLKDKRFKNEDILEAYADKIDKKKK